MMNKQMHIITPKLLEFSMVYPNEKVTIEQLLQNIPKSELINGALKFADYHNHYSRTESTGEFLRRFFGDVRSNEYYQILRIIEYYEQTFGTEVHIVYPTSSLLFFDFAFENGKEFDVNVSFNYKVENLNILKAYLLFNENVMNKFRNGFNSLDVSIEQNRANISIAGSISDNDILNYYLPHEIYYQFRKAQLLFLFLKTEQRTQKLYKKVLAYFNCQSVEELFHLIYYLVSPIEKSGRLTIAPTEDFTQIRNFLDNFILLKTSDGTDFIHIRNNPIFKEADGSYRIIYPKFVLEKVYKGWYFLLNQINSKDDSATHIKEFRSFYGFNFTEKFLVKYLLKNCFDKKAIQLSGDDIRKIRFEKNDGAEPDYYVRHWDEIYLFEIKETFLTKEAKTSFDFSLIEQELKEKLYSKKATGKPKAIRQLINVIRTILLEKVDYDIFKKSSRVKIYPILILSDEVFNATGLNNLLNKWFISELSLLNQELNIKRSKVNPLTIITIDTLTHLNPYLFKKIVKLKDLLDTYSENCIESNFSNRNVKYPYTPFSLFAKNYLEQKKLTDKIDFEEFLFVDEFINSEKPSIQL